ncbi:hypothetical protein R1flu_002188 [Riccia fluitans]|uniref:Uncharacterized protein n=1 Tax=Riccia fluitans TaxID=41844 RepID=A0ABD1Y5E0_9MARC
MSFGPRAAAGLQIRVVEKVPLVLRPVLIRPVPSPDLSSRGVGPSGWTYGTVLGSTVRKPGFSVSADALNECSMNQRSSPLPIEATEASFSLFLPPLLAQQNLAQPHIESLWLQTF